MPGWLTLAVVTPMHKVIETETEYVSLPGISGELGILHNHAPAVFGLGTGILRYGTLEGEKRLLFLSAGVAEVSANRVTVLADVAELAEDIDVLRAQAAKERAERRLARRTEQLDFHRAESALRRAVSRLKVAKEYDRGRR